MFSVDFLFWVITAFCSEEFALLLMGPTITSFFIPASFTAVFLGLNCLVKHNKLKADVSMFFKFCMTVFSICGCNLEGSEYGASIGCIGLIIIIVMWCASK